MEQKKGRVTIPTNLDVVKETLDIMNEWGADAIRDCDGTEFPQELKDTGAKIYATYYTTRKDNEWASANPEEIQQEYLISNRVTARGETLRIRLMEGFHTEQLKVNTLDDPKRWGKPLAALLGANRVQQELKLPSIGGKDSMSGTFENISVPPTLVSFAITASDVHDVMTPEAKEAGHILAEVQIKKDQFRVFDFDHLQKQYDAIQDLMKQKKKLY